MARKTDKQIRDEVYAELEAYVAQYDPENLAQLKKEIAAAKKAKADIPPKLRK
jgi:hypothetical protein